MIPKEGKVGFWKFELKFEVIFFSSNPLIFMCITKAYIYIFSQFKMKTCCFCKSLKEGGQIFAGLLMLSGLRGLRMLQQHGKEDSIERSVTIVTSCKLWFFQHLFNVAFFLLHILFVGHFSMQYNRWNSLLFWNQKCKQIEIVNFSNNFFKVIWFTIRIILLALYSSFLLFLIG